MEARKSHFIKIYLAKIVKYQKDAAGFIEFLNSMVKYEKKLKQTFLKIVC